MEFLHLQFLHAWVLLAGLPWIGICVWWMVSQRKNAIVYSDERLLVAPMRWMIYVWRTGIAAVFLAGFFAVAALAGPVGKITESRVYEEMHRGCLVMDISLSMNAEEDPITRATRIQVIVKAAKEFVHKRQGDQLCMVPFETGVRLALAVSPTTDVILLDEALDNLPAHVDGNTAMGDGMFFAFSMLLGDTLGRDERLNISLLQKEIAEVKGGRMEGLAYIDDLVARNGMLSDTFLLVLTDGKYNTGVVDPLALLTVLKRFGLKTYVLGVGKEFTANDRLVRMVKETGGDVLYARDAVNETPQFLEAINRLQKRKILTEIMHKQRELAPLMMRIALVCLLLFLSVFIVLRGGGVFGLLSAPHGERAKARRKGL